MAWTGGPRGQAKVQMNKQALAEARERDEISAWLKETLAMGRQWEARRRGRKRRSR